MNMEANREISWAIKVGVPAFYGGYWRIRIIKQWSPGPFIDSDQYSTEVCWSGVEDEVQSSTPARVQNSEQK